MATTPKEHARRWINNVRVSLDQSPLLVRIDFSLGPFYERGDQVRLVDLDPAAGHVLGTVVDIKKIGKGVFAVVEWHEYNVENWNPQEME